jgi:hypothetical protein
VQFKHFVVISVRDASRSKDAIVGKWSASIRFGAPLSNNPTLRPEARFAARCLETFGPVSCGHYLTTDNINVRAFNAIWMSGLGLVAIGYGLLNKQMRFRDGSRIKPGWQSLLARSWFVVLGAGFVILAIYQLRDPG